MEKGDKSRSVFITEVCRHYIDKYLHGRKTDNPYLFLNNNGKPYTKDTLRILCHRIGNRVGISNCHPHRFRRTFATICFKNGMDLLTIQKLMGHSDINVTKRYICFDYARAKIEYDKYYR